MTPADSTFVDPPGLIRFSIPDEWESFLGRYERYRYALGDVKDLDDPTPQPRPVPLSQGDEVLIDLETDQCLREVFRFIRHNATHVLIEDTYFDSDHRDEYAKHYAHVFHREPQTCERIHLFAIDPDLSDGDAERELQATIEKVERALRVVADTGDREALDQAIENYSSMRDRPVGLWWGECLGFIVLRPSLNHPVARTVLRPPRNVAARVSCTTAFGARPAGFRYKVNGFPFLSQDGQLSSCAHAAIWMIAYYHHESNGTRRVYLSDIANATGLRPEETPGEVDRGMTIDQMASVFRKIGLPAIYHSADADSPKMIKRYLNSRLPVLVASRDHAMVLVGYGTDDTGPFWIAHNDLHGPYITVHPRPANRESYQSSDDAILERTWVDTEIGRWEGIFIPRPSHTLYMTGDQAENLGSQSFKRIVLELPGVEKTDELAASGNTSLRTYTIQANDYKERLRARVSERVCRLHIAEPMPKWVWVVELHDEHRATHAADSVIGEVVLDATADSETAGVLCGNVPGLWFKRESRLLDEVVLDDRIDEYPMYESGIPLPIAD